MDGTRGYDISKYKMLLSMFKGRTKVKVDVRHENDKRSCMIVDFEIRKNGEEEAPSKK